MKKDAPGVVSYPGDMTYTEMQEEGQVDMSTPDTGILVKLSHKRSDIPRKGGRTPRERDHGKKATSVRRCPNCQKLIAATSFSVHLLFCPAPQEPEEIQP